jgi:GMP synthase PP-ATPase subunit
VFSLAVPMLGVPSAMLDRQPFPGLGVRILGDVTPEKVRVATSAMHNA